MGNDNIKKRMSPAELREVRICAAATATISYVLGYGYIDISVIDGGSRWPTTASYVETALWPIGDDPGPGGGGGPSCDRAYRDIATIYEVAGLASRKLRGLGSHELSLIDDSIGSVMLNDPKIWAAIEALAVCIDEGEDQALGDDKEGKYADTGGEGGAGLKVLKEAGLTPNYWAAEGEAAWRAHCEWAERKLAGAEAAELGDAS